MADNKQFLEKLAAPFDPFDIEWRVQTAGKNRDGKLYAMVIPYITNRAIQERLDEVCGADGWYNKFDYPNDKSVLCSIAIRFMRKGAAVNKDLDIVDNFEWITKQDGASETNIEAVKGGLSSAMKRAAVQWGIGRYLYRLESAWVSPLDKQPDNLADYIVTMVKLEGKSTRIYFKRPKLPTWAIPKADDEQTL